MNNDINNKKIEIPKGISLNDKDYLNILLELLKCTQKNLAVSLTEASNEILYKEFNNMFLEFATIQRNAYELMYKCGWYKLEKAPKTKVKTLISDLETEVNNLN